MLNPPLRFAFGCFAGFDPPLLHPLFADLPRFFRGQVGGAGVDEEIFAQRGAANEHAALHGFTADQADVDFFADAAQFHFRFDDNTL